MLGILKTTDFDKIANTLLNKSTLCIADKEFRICEIEFYLKNDEHNDVYTHADEDQKSVGKWYFHKRGGAYKGGTFKGLDLTFGKDSYGGVLIRSIQNNQTNKIIEGPCRVVNQILSLTNNLAIKDLVPFNAPQLDALDPTSPLYVKSSALKDKEEIFTGPRVGLTLRYTTEDRKDYLMKPYRYLIKFPSIKKNWATVIYKLHQEGLSVKEIHEKTTYKTRVIEKAIASYDSAEVKDMKEIINLEPKTSPSLIILYKSWFAYMANKN